MYACMHAGAVLSLFVIAFKIGLPFFISITGANWMKKVVRFRGSKTQCIDERGRPSDSVEFLEQQISWNGDFKVRWIFILVFVNPLDAVSRYC